MFAASIPDNWNWLWVISIPDILFSIRRSWWHCWAVTARYWLLKIACRLVVDKETGKPKGYGFCEYKDEETALSARRNLQGHDVNGRQLRVDFAENGRNTDRNREKVEDPQSITVEEPYFSPSKSYVKMKACMVLVPTNYNTYLFSNYHVSPVLLSRTACVCMYRFLSVHMHTCYSAKLPWWNCLSGIANLLWYRGSKIIPNVSILPSFTKVTCQSYWGNKSNVMLTKISRIVLNTWGSLQIAKEELSCRGCICGQCIYSRILCDMLKQWCCNY